MVTILLLLSLIFLQEIVVHLLGEICHILPHAYQDQCRSVTSKFGKTVVDAILGFASPHAICALIHLCKGQEDTQVGQSVMCLGCPLHNA